jgi:hypothetical protein
MRWSIPDIKKLCLLVRRDQMIVGRSLIRLERVKAMERLWDAEGFFRIQMVGGLRDLVVKFEVVMHCIQRCGFFIWDLILLGEKVYLT